MNIFSKQSLFPLRACMNCGSWINLRTFFCLKCHDRCLEQFQNPSEIRVENIKVKSLLRWPPGESDVLSALILQMKNEPLSSWNIWAQEFVFTWDEILSRKESILISSESASGKKHAQNWAQALSGYLQYPHICPLKPRAATVKQRQLGRRERANRAFDLSVEFSNFSNNRIIFADDVITTGQTALAAYKALNKPRDFEIWCLIYREL